MTLTSRQVPDEWVRQTERQVGMTLSGKEPGLWIQTNLGSNSGSIEFLAVCLWAGY